MEIKTLQCEFVDEFGKPERQVHNALAVMTLAELRALAEMVDEGMNSGVRDGLTTAADDEACEEFVKQAREIVG